MTEITENTFFALWKYTFKCQLRVLFDRLGKTVQIEDDGYMTYPIYASEFDDFCLYVYESCPELIDESQN